MDTTPSKQTDTVQIERARCLLATKGNKAIAAAATVTGSIKANSWAASALPVTINIQPDTVTHAGNSWRARAHFCLSACLLDGHRMRQRRCLANIYKAELRSQLESVVAFKHVTAGKAQV